MMELRIERDRGWTCDGGEDAVVAGAIAHADEVHRMQITREQVLAVATPVEPPEAR